MNLLKNLFSGSTSNEAEKDINQIAEEALLDSRSELILTRVKKDIDRELPYTSLYDRTLLAIICTIREMDALYLQENGASNSIKNFQTYFNKKIPEYLIHQYYITNNYIHGYTEKKSTYEAIYNFAKFLIISDALLMFNNDDTENIYSIPQSSDSIKMMIINDNYDIQYHFTKDITKDKSKSLLEEYLEDDNSKDSILGFVEVQRNNGSKTKSSFTFDLDGNIKSSSLKDEILFETIIHNTIETIDSTYIRILNNAVPVYTGEKLEGFDLMDYLINFTGGSK